MTNDRQHQEGRVIFGLYGAGGFAREVMPFARQVVARLSLRPVDVFFVETTPVQTQVNGIPVLSEQQFFALPAARKFFNVAIADAKAREAIAERCFQAGAAPLALKAHNTTVYDCNDIGEGAILCANTVVTVNAKIGRFFHANLFSYVAHDCVIGDFVTFAPQVQCNSNVHIGAHAYLGTGAIIRPGKPDKPLLIGEGVKIGMGAIVTKDVPAYTTIMAIPARPI